MNASGETRKGDNVTKSMPAKLLSKANWIRWTGAIAFAVLAWSATESANLVRELAPGVFVRMGNRDRNQPANCGWVVFHDYVLVIDANFPWGAKEILPEIRRTTKNKPIRFVFNTHYHGDHAYGGSLFTDAGATIVCSEDCAGESRTKGRPAGIRTRRRASSA